MQRPLLIVMLFVIAVIGCDSPEKKQSDRTAAAPPPTYSGPEFLHGTVGSLTTIRGYRAAVVSGYGLVVGLNGTGSGDVPPALRDWFVSEMSRRGFGKESLGYGRLSPARVLASDDTAVVLVSGIIPPGAPAGTRFDLVVEALPETQTASLGGGTLYTTDLSVGGHLLERSGRMPVARGRGPLFLNPFLDPETDVRDLPDSARTARILSGGVSTEDMHLAIVLRRPSYRVSKQIADRINTRFPHDELEDRSPLAVAKSDAIIQLIPTQAFKRDTQHLLRLINHLYRNPRTDYAVDKAHELLAMIEEPENRKFAGNVALVWEAMGKPILPVLREIYDHPEPVVAMAALEAGARLGDALAAPRLTEFAGAAGSTFADRATAMLGKLVEDRPDNLKVIATLRQLLDSEDALVRIKAMQALAAVEDAAINERVYGQRGWRRNPATRRLVSVVVHPPKAQVLLVEAETPMIYVSREHMPRIAIYNKAMPVRPDELFSIWQNQLMVRASDDGETLSVFYQDPAADEPRVKQIAPYVPNLVALLAETTDDERGTVGFDLSYSRIVQVLYQMSTQGVIEAPFRLESSNLANRITTQRAAVPTPTRAETEEEAQTEKEE